MSTREGVYLAGDYYVLCDICGFKKRRSECTLDWERKLVCSDTCLDERNPQEDVAAVPSRQSVLDAREAAPVLVAATVMPDYDYPGFDFYVDVDDGDDDNTGDAPSRAWATVAHLVAQSIPAGSRIGFKRGTTIREFLDVPASGSSASDLVIGAYGDGVAPLFLGSSAVSGAWTNVAGNEYKRATSLTTSGTTPAYFVSSAGVTTRLEKGTAGALTANQFDITGGFIHVNVGSDPTSGSVEVPLRSICIRVSGKSNVTIQDVECRYAGNDGISIRSGATAVTVTRTVCRFNANDGCNVFTASYDLDINFCDFSDNGERTTFVGDGFSAHLASSGTIRNCTMRRNAKNAVANSESGTWLYSELIGELNAGGDFAIYDDSGNSPIAGSHVMSRCVAYSGGPDRGTAIYKYLAEPTAGASIKFYNCVAAKGTDSNSFPRGFRVAGSNGSVEIKNSVISGAFQFGIVKAGASTIDHDHLCVNGATTAYSGTSAGAHSITSAPSFIDAANGNFTPASGSPLIDAGVAIAGITDGFRGSAPDIGVTET